MASNDLELFDPKGNRFPVLADADEAGGMAALVEENLGGEALRPSELPQFKIPSGKSKAFDYSDEDADAISKVTGVVLFETSPRAWWEKSISARKEEDSKAPDCSSTDSVIGIGRYGKDSQENPTGACETCPMNQYATARNDDGSPGRGKACKEQKVVWMMREDGMLPESVRLPPTSHQALRKYRVGLTTKLKKPISGVVTEIGLQAAKSAGGIDYSEATFKAVGVLTPEQRDAMKKIGSDWRGILDQAAIEEAKATAAQTIDGVAFEDGVDVAPEEYDADGDDEVPEEYEG